MKIENHFGSIDVTDKDEFADAMYRIHDAMYAIKKAIRAIREDDFKDSDFPWFDVEYGLCANLNNHIQFSHETNYSPLVNAMPVFRELFCEYSRFTGDYDYPIPPSPDHEELPAIVYYASTTNKYESVYDRNERYQLASDIYDYVDTYIHRNYVEAILNKLQALDYDINGASEVFYITDMFSIEHNFNTQKWNLLAGDQESPFIIEIAQENVIDNVKSILVQESMRLNQKTKKIDDVIAEFLN